MPPTPAEDHRVICHIDVLLTARGITQTELAERMGLSLVNLSILKNNHARAIRFSTLTALCEALDCQPGDLFTVTPPPNAPRKSRPGVRDWLG
jgi:putative transcriptional regulator